MRLSAALSALVLLSPVRASAQTDPVLESRRAYQAAIRAYEAHDYPAFLIRAKEAERLRPTHGGVIYTLACAYALTGDTAAALVMLNRYDSPRYAEPTLGVIVGHELCYVANSQWERFGENGYVADSSALLPPTVLRLRL
jgi:hypothetical protein